MNENKIYTIHGLSLVLNVDRGLIYRVLHDKPQDDIINKRYKGWSVASYQRHYREYLNRRYNHNSRQV